MLKDQEKKIIVTGGGGQLAQCIAKQASAVTHYKFLFVQKKDLDITDAHAIDQLFVTFKPDFVINTAAYTQVDRAEDEHELAFAINSEGAKNLAQACKKYKATLVHISTDYVFDGNSNTPYVEEDQPNPQTVYGKSKLAGENEILDSELKAFYILRTSWLYSEFGQNFYKTMQRLAATRDKLAVVNDQQGCPTNANDLARGILKIIADETRLDTGNTLYGIYNFANGGSTSWYGFARAIFNVKNIDVELSPVSSEAYPTRAKRPAFSMLDNNKFKNAFDFQIPDWEKSLVNL
ncbi:dTDP-4-dehydrorhamnose reductase [Flavimarina sp. Hel_I_48]|uniref:dTDP-4-dehydrorhamnose reductase n=1 Tax=Flavimarina sp. Hel_I_48 TaxID=1392488 RepID=UPI0004DF89C6|nr:dTDP-4-dehydrorhamnose reductase [Flavimarina sp. Hel_I_48]